MKDAQIARGGWQPIDTAPKDGTPVLLVEGGTEAVGEAEWHEYGKGWWWANCHPTDYQDRQVFNPTHWMPLPDPPTQEPSP